MIQNKKSFSVFSFEQSGSRGRSQLVISPVMEADTGDYECWAQAESTTAQQVKKILKVGQWVIMVN